MSDVTRLLDAAAAGDPAAAADLLPVVYEELRKLAACRLAAEPAGQTLQPTALVHEAYLRLVGSPARDWNGRGHFFGAAAEAMRRILVEAARRRQSQKRGGGRPRRDLAAVNPAVPEDPEDVLALDEALGELERHDPQAAALVKLRYYAGLSQREAAATLGLPIRTADRVWALARAWLFRQLTKA